jgi:hypothetical protein
MQLIFTAAPSSLWRKQLMLALVRQAKLGASYRVKVPIWRDHEYP